MTDFPDLEGTDAERVVDDRTLDLFNTTEVELPGHTPQDEEARLREKEKREQLALFSGTEEWREHWREMPKFEQRDLTPYRTIYVHFEREEDVAAFAELVAQKITDRTRMIWFPEAEIGRFADKRWVDAQFAARAGWGGHDDAPSVDVDALNDLDPGAIR